MYIIKNISYPYIYNVPHTYTHPYIYIYIVKYFFMFQMLPIANVPLHIANCWPRNAPGSSAKEPLREPLIEPTCHSYRWDSLRFAENCEAYEALFSACAFSSSSSLRRVWISNSTWGFVWQVEHFLSQPESAWQVWVSMSVSVFLPSHLSFQISHFCGLPNALPQLVEQVWMFFEHNRIQH